MSQQTRKEATMSSQHHHPSTWQLLVLTAALLLCSSGWHSTFGQDWNVKIGGDSRPNRAPDPPTDLKRISSTRPANRSKRTPSNLPLPSPDTRTDEKHQAIEQAIADGNEARDKNDYEHALAHYQKEI